MTFKPGDVVMLRSGSPAMTVKELGEHQDAHCLWFHGNDLHNDWFPLVTLKGAPTIRPAAPSAPAGRPAAVSAQASAQAPAKGAPAAR